MKISKSRLIEIIREEIQNFNKEQIQEFVSTATVTGAQKKGYTSSRTKTKQRTYDTKVADTKTKKTAKTSADTTYDTKLSAYNTKVAAEPHRYKYSVRGIPTTGDSPPRGASRIIDNPAWTTWSSEKTSAQSERDTALSDRTSKRTAYDTAVSDESSALSDLDTQRAADLMAQVPKDMPPAVGAAMAAFGRGKSAGKAGKGGKGKGGRGKAKEKK